MKLNANLMFKHKYLLPILCKVTKTVELCAAEFERFSGNLLVEYDFIRDNQASMGYADGLHRCLLVVSAGHDYGILVDSEGHGYARYTAMVPEIGLLLDAQRLEHSEIMPRLGPEMEMSQ